MDDSKPTIWQRLNGMPWYLKSIQFWVVGFFATYLFVSVGLDPRIAVIAGLFGINIAIFLTVAYLADQDDRAREEA